MMKAKYDVHANFRKDYVIKIIAKHGIFLARNIVVIMYVLIFSHLPGNTIIL